jgi:hypothetical protein
MMGDIWQEGVGVERIIIYSRQVVEEEEEV